MNIMRTFVACALVALATGHTASEAVALRQEKTTDASVCDLGPNTNAVLGRRVLVPAGASSKDQVDAYFRLAATFIAESCGNGQLMIVHGEAGDQVDVASLEQVANSSCTAAAVTRSEVPYTYAGRSRPGFELRCTISKHAALVQKLVELERTDPMDRLTARMHANVQQSGHGSSAGGTSGQGKRDCGNVTLASLLQGGSCK